MDPVDPIVSAGATTPQKKKQSANKSADTRYKPLLLVRTPDRPTKPPPLKKRVERVDPDLNLRAKLFDIVRSVGTVSKVKLVCTSTAQFCHFNGKQFEKFTTFDLSDGEISTLPDRLVACLPKVTRLILANNHFTTLPPSLHKLAEGRVDLIVDIRGNPLEFNAQMAAQATALIQKGVEFITDNEGLEEYIGRIEQQEEE